MRWLIIFLVISIPAFALQIADEQSTMEFDNILQKDEKIALASSYLKEKSKPRDYYSPNKAIDKKKNTAWVAGGKNQGIGEYIVLSAKIIGSRYNHKPAKIKIKIINGYAESKKLFSMNNRVKKAELIIYEAPIVLLGGSNKTINDPMVGRRKNCDVILNDVLNLQLKDTMEEQVFDIVVTPKHQCKWRSVYCLMGKFIIKEIYHGSKYPHTCVSEISISGTSMY